MPLVRLNNTQPRLLHLPPLIVTAGDVKKDGVEYGPRVSGEETGSSIPPGFKNIEESEWKRASKHHVVKEWLRLGWLQVGGDVQDPEGVPAPTSLAGYNQPAAIAIVEMENSLEHLSRWKAAESRVDVVNALNVRLEVVSGMGKFKGR